MGEEGILDQRALRAPQGLRACELGVREVLLLDRDSKAVELFRLRDNRLVSIGASSTDASQELHLETIELSVSWRA